MTMNLVVPRRTMPLWITPLMFSSPEISIGRKCRQPRNPDAASQLPSSSAYHSSSTSPNSTRYIRRKRESDNFLLTFAPFAGECAVVGHGHRRDCSGGAAATNAAATDNCLLSVRPDRWRGIGLDSSLHFRHLSLDAFRVYFQAALKHWRGTGIRPVTVKIHESDSHFIPVVVEAGFQFHHAQPGYVYLKRWIADGEPDSFPAYANHYLGVAGFVVDRETDEMLVIKERFAPKPMWKLPGGSADTGEDLHEIARREVKEETGVDTEFVGVVCFRHMHNFRYGCSDFYFVCHLRPLTKEITMDESEIADCQWMKVDEYLEKQAPTAMNKHFVQCYKDYLNQDKFQGVIGKKAVHHHINKVDYNVYSIYCVD